MATIQRRRVRWTGFSGAPGISTSYAIEGAALSVAWRNFYLAIAAQLPSTVTVTIDSSGDELSETTGQITGTWNDVPVAPVTGGGGNVYDAPAGFLVEWLTEDIGAHRRVIGKTFLVPGVSTGVGGTFSAGQLAAITNAANAFVAAASPPDSMVGWSRPTGAGNNGVRHIVTGARVPNKVVVLRSRRD